MRSLKELYSILLDNISVKKFTFGVCHEINRLVTMKSISVDEYNYLNDDWRKRKFIDGKDYWWPKDDDGDRQRIEFVKCIINEL